MALRYSLACLAMCMACAADPAGPSSYRPLYVLENDEQLRVYDQEIRKALKHAPHGDLHGLRDEARERASALVAIAQERFGTPEVPLSEIVWGGLTPTSIAGEAFCEDGGARLYIKLNEIMFLRNHAAFQNDVIPHEVAHLLLCQMDLRMEHSHADPRFVSVMEFLVGRATEKHDLDAYPSCVLDQRLKLAKTSSRASYRHVPSSPSACERDTREE